LTRQWLLNQIRKIKQETNLPNRIIASEGFIYQPKYLALKNEFDKYRLDKEEWHQIVRFALSSEEEHRYMYERLLQLLLRHRSSYNSYFKLKTESATVPLPDRIAEISKLLSMYKEYFQIFKDIVHRIHFDYPLRKYKEYVVHGKINWHDTLRNNPIGFPIKFDISKWHKEFGIPENTLLLLGAIWLNNDAKRIIHIDFIEPLSDKEKSLLNYIISKTQNIVTFFPFADVLHSATRFSSLIPMDKRVLQLQQLAEYRISQGTVKFTSYKLLIEWIKRYKRLNIRMISPFTSNYPLETLENIDTIYEAWIFFEFIDYFSNMGLLLEIQIDQQPYYFDFANGNHKFRFYYERRFLKGSEHAWAVESHPDFSVMKNNRIVAVFDAKNYGAFSTSGDATHKMLAYMTNLDCGFGGLFFPNFDTIEYNFPRDEDKPAHHFNLLLGHYNMKPQSSADALKIKDEVMRKIFSQLDVIQLLQIG
jgi:hypothetical protein